MSPEDKGQGDRPHPSENKQEAKAQDTGPPLPHVPPVPGAPLGVGAPGKEPEQFFIGDHGGGATARPPGHGSGRACTPPLSGGETAGRLYQVRVYREENPDPSEDGAPPHVLLRGLGRGNATRSGDEGTWVEIHIPSLETGVEIPLSALGPWSSTSEGRIRRASPPADAREVGEDAHDYSGRCGI